MTHTPPTQKPTMPIVNGQPSAPGCYISGHWGQYAVDRLAALCDVFAPHKTETDHWARATATARTREDWETLAQLDEYMTERINCSTRGGHWYWEDGEFFLHDAYICRDCGYPSDTPQCDVCADTQYERSVLSR